MQGKALEISPWHAWCEAVLTVASRARATLPQCATRIEKAVKLALAGDVRLLEDGTALVVSQRNDATLYQVVAGHCTCPDAAQAPSGLCKHRLAVAIATRAYASTTPHSLPSNGHPTPQKPPPPAPAAAYSATVQVVKDGFEVCLTIEKPGPERDAWYAELATLTHQLCTQGYAPSRPAPSGEGVGREGLAHHFRTSLLVLLGLLLGIALCT